MKILFSKHLQRLAILIDGMHLENLCLNEFHIVIDYALLSQGIHQIVKGKATSNLELFRTYHYDSMPLQGSPPTPDDVYRAERKEHFLNALRGLPRYTIREGVVAYRGRRENGITIAKQKMVDVLLSLDIAILSLKKQVSHIAVITGDADYVPAFQLAREEGIIVWLFHGPSKSSANGLPTYANALWQEADERYEMDSAFMKKALLKHNRPRR